MNSSPLRPLLAAATLACITVAFSGCNDDPTSAVVENAFPARSDASAPMTVYKVWWATTLFPSPVVAGAVSETERTIPGEAYAYALLAPGWSPTVGGSPARLVAMRSAHELAVSEHGLLRIVVSDETFIGDCAAGKPLGADEARTIERLFPGELAGTTYDPATCAMTQAAVDGGVDAGPPTNDAGAEAASDAGGGG